jgi:hypothetical protein
VHHGQPDAAGAERRRVKCELLYDLEMVCREQGWGDSSYVHDEERELFRFHDGRFAFFREHADWAPEETGAAEGVGVTTRARARSRAARREARPLSRPRAGRWSDR